MLMLMLTAILLLAFCSYASDEPHIPAIRKFSISHFQHPGLTPYLEKMRLAYKDIGIEVEFIEMPADRGLMSLQKGLVDADFGRFDYSLKETNDITIINTPVGRGFLVLICQRHLPCDESVLYDKNNTITGTETHKALVKADYKVTAQIEVHNQALSTLKLLKLNRINYAFYGVDDTFINILKKDYQVQILLNTNVYHIIHQKHKHLQKPLTDSLQKHFGEWRH